MENHISEETEVILPIFSYHGTVKEVIRVTIEKSTGNKISKIIYIDLEFYYENHDEAQRVGFLSDGYRNIICLDDKNRLLSDGSEMSI